jgi:hypothetical protein
MSYNPFEEFLNVASTPRMQRQVDQVNEQFAAEGLIDPAVYLAVFSTPEGLLVLQDLHQRFVDVHRCMPGEPEGSGFYREGMAAVVYHMAAMIERAASGEETNG